MGKSNANLKTCWSSLQMQCFDNNPVWQVSSTGWKRSFSVIGVPGMAIGSAWYDDAQQHPAAGGALVGYLTTSVIVNSNGVTNSGNAYSFVFGPEQYVVVDTCVKGTAPACVISINGYLNGGSYVKTILRRMGY
jgi:hypothetical protein